MQHRDNHEVTFGGICQGEVAGPTSARQHTSFTPELAQTNFLVCADGHDLLPGVAHLLKGATASRHGKTGPGREGGSRIRL